MTDFRHEIEAFMGRPPIKKRAMTDAERQRRRRQKLAKEGAP